MLSHSQIGVDRRGVGTVAGEEFPRVLLGRGTDVVAFGVQDHRDTWMLPVDVRDQLLEFRLGTFRREVGDLRLEGAHQVRRRIDDVAAEGEQRLRRPFEMRRDAVETWIETDAEGGIRSPPGLTKPLVEGVRHARHCSEM